MKFFKRIIIKNIKIVLSKWGFSRQGIFNNSRGEWYLFSQIFIILLHFVPPYPVIMNMAISLTIFFSILGLIISVIGLIIIIRGFIDLGENLTPLPHPLNESILVKNNSYKYVRHPIYMGLLFTSLGICIWKVSVIHLLLLISLSYILKIKALKEEEMLKLKFTEYKKYIKEVPAILNKIKYLDWRS